MQLVPKCVQVLQLDDAASFMDIAQGQPQATTVYGNIVMHDKPTVSPAACEAHPNPPQDPTAA